MQNGIQYHSHKNTICYLNNVSLEHFVVLEAVCVMR